MSGSETQRAGAVARRVDAFVGIEVSVDIANALLVAVRNIAPALGDRVPGVRWVSPLDLHVLLHRLPGVDEEVLEAVADAIMERAEGLAPFDLGVRGLGLGPDPRASTALWAGLIDPTGRLAELQQRVTEAVASLGFEEPPPACPPHIAVALFPPVELPALVRSALDTLSEEGFGVLHVPHVGLFVRDAGGGASFRVSRHAPLRMPDPMAVERFAAPAPHRAERSPALGDRARRQLEAVRGEDEG